MHDPIADMLIRMKNAGVSRKETVEFPFTKMKLAICDVLKNEGFITDFARKGKKVSNKVIEVTLKYVAKQPKITGVTRLSKYSKRVYGGAADIKPVKQGKGILVLSTPKGILSGADARKEKVGGELLFKLW